MHKLLKEQIERYLGNLDDASEGLRALLEAVDSVYQEGDFMRTEHSRDNISDELIKRYDRLEEEIEERAQAERELKLYAKRLETLHEIDRAILNAGSPEEIACAAVERLIEVVKSSWASVLLADFSSGEMKKICTAPIQDAKEPKYEVLQLDDPVNYKLKEGIVLAVKDIREVIKPSKYEIRLMKQGIRSYLLVPLVARDHLVGILEMADVKANSFDAETVQIAEEVADQVAVAVQQAALLDEVQRLNENLEQRITDRTIELENRANEILLLNEMGEKLHSCVNSIEAYQVISHHLPKIFPGLDGALGIVMNSGEALKFVAAWGANISRENEFKKEDCWALRRGQAHFVEEKRPGLLCRHVDKDDGYQPWLSTFCMPLLAQKNVIGILYLRNKNTKTKTHLASGEEFSNAKRQLALTVAEQISLAMTNLNLQESLRMQAIRDPLTGLYNRRYMEESLAREVQRSARTKGGLGVIMLDIDHFKSFNDDYGHAVGDTMLRELGGFIREKIRQEDIACKYGGEEFVLILPNATAEITVQRAEFIRKNVKSIQVEVREGEFKNITVSLGVSSYPVHGKKWEDLLKAADKALYLAKEKGRDKVVVAE